jgi:hypothetical protein
MLLTGLEASSLLLPTGQNRWLGKPAEFNGQAENLLNFLLDTQDTIYRLKKSIGKKIRLAQPGPILNPIKPQTSPQLVDPD